MIFPPTLKTHGEEVGNAGLSGRSELQPSLVRPGAPASPDYATNVTPRRLNFINSTFVRFVYFLALTFNKHCGIVFGSH